MCFCFLLGSLFFFEYEVRHIAKGSLLCESPLRDTGGVFFVGCIQSDLSRDISYRIRGWNRKVQTPRAQFFIPVCTVVRAVISYHQDSSNYVTVQYSSVL